eukprot:11190459-Lingulodinium_polyedra.AAC.1
MWRHAHKIRDLRIVQRRNDAMLVARHSHATLRAELFGQRGKQHAINAARRISQRARNARDAKRATPQTMECVSTVPNNSARRIAWKCV